MTISHGESIITTLLTNLHFYLSADSGAANLFYSFIVYLTQQEQKYLNSAFRGWSLLFCYAM